MTAPKYYISDSSVYYEGYSISSKGSLPKVVDIMSFILNSPIPVHFGSLIPKMLMFILVVFCLTMSNLLSPPDSRCHFCFGPAYSFFLELLVIALCSSPVAYWTHSTWGFIFWCYFFLPFHTVYGALGSCFSKPFTMTHPSWVPSTTCSELCFIAQAPLP